MTNRPQFWRSKEETEESFLDAVYRITKQSFSTGSEAKTWLESNGYWTNFEEQIDSWNLNFNDVNAGAAYEMNTNEQTSGKYGTIYFNGGNCMIEMYVNDTFANGGVNIIWYEQEVNKNDVIYFRLINPKFGIRSGMVTLRDGATDGNIIDTFNFSLGSSPP